MEPWIDVSPACPAGRERLRLDVLSSPLPFSPSLSLSLFPSLCVYPGPLIRRERGDNSSPSLSLDDARVPRASSLTRSPRPLSSCPPPSADTPLSLSLRRLVSSTGPVGRRRRRRELFPSAFCDTALRGWGSRCEGLFFFLARCL